MKNILTAIALFVGSTSFLQAATDSPDGKFVIKAGDSIIIQNSAGEPVLVLTKVGAIKRIEAAWSPDSQRVVVVTAYGGGSAIFGAWHEGDMWHKSLELDSDLSPITKQIGSVISESRSLGPWSSPNTVAINGAMISRGNKHWTFGYTLHFQTGSAQTYKLDRAGFEEGALVGKDYYLNPS
jgi:hypothetical protein